MRWQWLDAVSAVRAADFSSLYSHKLITVVFNSSKINTVRRFTHWTKLVRSRIRRMQPSDRYRLFSSLTLCEGNINTFFLSWHHFSDKNFISWPTTETRVVGSSRLLMCAHLNPWQCCQVSEFIWPESEETDVGHFPRKVEIIPAWWISCNQSVGTSLLGIATALWVNIFIQGVEYVCSAVWPVRSPARRTLRRTLAELFWARIKAELWAVLLSALEAEESGMSLSCWMPVKEVWTFKQNETLNTGRLFFLFLTHTKEHRILPIDTANWYETVVLVSSAAFSASCSAALWRKRGRDEPVSTRSQHTHLQLRCEHVHWMHIAAGEETDVWQQTYRAWGDSAGNAALSSIAHLPAPVF